MTFQEEPITPGFINGPPLYRTFPLPLLISHDAAVENTDIFGAGAAALAAILCLWRKKPLWWLEVRGDPP